MHGRTSVNWQWEDINRNPSGERPRLDGAFFVPFPRKVVKGIAAQGVRGLDGVSRRYEKAVKIFQKMVTVSSIGKRSMRLVVYPLS